jgi:hypothetical protein
LAQLLWDRLITQADDQGRLIADPEVVKGQCMPLVKEATASKVARWLDQLEEQGMIERYEADGHQLLQLRTWWDAQNSMRRAYPSRWTPLPGWEDRVFGLPSQAGNGTAPTPPPSGQRAGKMPAQTPQSASNGPAPSGQGAGKVPSAPRARMGAGGEPNLTEGTYVPKTEAPPSPPLRLLRAEQDNDDGLRLASAIGGFMAGGNVSPAGVDRLRDWPAEFAALFVDGDQAVIDTCRRMAEDAVRQGKSVHSVKFFEGRLGQQRDDKARGRNGSRPGEHRAEITAEQRAALRNAEVESA